MKNYNNPKAQLFSRLLMVAPIVDVWTRTDRAETYTILPRHLRNKASVQLQYGLNLPRPIDDLYIGEGAVTGTLSFSSYPEWTRVSWDDVFMMGIDGRGHIFDEEYMLQIFGVSKLAEEQRPYRQHASGLRVYEGGRKGAPPPRLPRGAA